MTEPLVKFLDESDAMKSWEPTSIVLSTFVTNKWWQAALHNQTNWWIRQTIIEVPYLLKENID